MPTKDLNAAFLTFNVLQTNGQSNTSGFSDLHSNRLSFIGEGRVRTNFFGLTGHQLIGGGHSNSEFTSLSQNLRFIVENRAIAKQDGSWMIYYNFDQYLYEPNRGSDQGFGIFGRFGVSDGNPNPMHFFYSVGVGGKGILPGRPLDRFGAGFYYIDVSSLVEETQAKATAYTEHRHRTRPPGATMGSMFKNPEGDYAGRLIEAAGLKGAVVGDAEISTLHANFFINRGRATAKDIYDLINLAQKTVFEKFGVQLDQEIELIGEWN